MVPLLAEEFVASEEAMEVGDEDGEPPSRFVSGMLSSIGDGRPREMISLCSSSSELMECFCRMSGPVIDLAMSGLGKSLKVVCCREGIPPSVRVYVRVVRKSPAATTGAAALPAWSSFCWVFVYAYAWYRLLHTLSRRFVSRSLGFVVGGATTTESAFRVKPVKRRERSFVFLFRPKNTSDTLTHTQSRVANKRKDDNERTDSVWYDAASRQQDPHWMKYCFLD